MSPANENVTDSNITLHTSKGHGGINLHGNGKKFRIHYLKGQKNDFTITAASVTVYSHGAVGFNRQTMLVLKMYFKHTYFLQPTGSCASNNFILYLGVVYTYWWKCMSSDRCSVLISYKFVSSAFWWHTIQLAIGATSGA